MGIIKFNNISSDSLGLVVQFKPAYEYPEKEYETLHIPGRNGDLMLDNGSFQNVERSYSVARVFKPGEVFPTIATSLVSWLQSTTGYARLEDSYEPDYYRMAVYERDGTISNYYDQATAFDITFKCKPQRWLKSGENWITLSSGEFVPENPTSYYAYPVIKFNTIANTPADIVIGDKTIHIKSINESVELTIDCENMECYSGTTLYNSYVELTDNEFPSLAPHETTTIEYSNINNFKIQPRWWTI